MRQRQWEASTDNSGQWSSSRKMVRAGTEDQHGAEGEGEAAEPAGLRAMLLNAHTSEARKELREDFQYKQKWVSNKETDPY